MFVNQVAFNNPISRMQAIGTDTRPEKAVVDLKGNPLIRPRTGGMYQPVRYELPAGTILFRFVGQGTPIKNAVTGGWWVEQSQFQIISNFSQKMGIGVALAARLLCCVPPEWSDMGLLIRVKVQEPLLAYRGLGNSVSTPAKDSLGNVEMTAHNDIAARRLYQLFIPGLFDYAKRTPDRKLPGAMVVENQWPIKKEEANKGWLYLKQS